jgi:MoaA/NifB/PqqE/SkfB family radical SAM enzyme
MRHRNIRGENPTLRALGYTQKYTISRLITHRPILLTHSLTSKCNCRCKICDLWRKQSTSQEMGTDEIRRMLGNAKDLDFVAYLGFGGEPLARPDALDIFRHARRLGLFTSMITNGTYLPGRAKEVAEAVDLTWISLDYNSDYHDEMRGFKGAYSSAMEGLKELKKEGGKIVINCVLSKLNLNSVKAMAELAVENGVKVAFDPMTVFQGINEEYGLSDDERKALFSEVLQLKRSGYPILNSFEFLNHMISPVAYSCAQPKIFVNVQENGEVVPFWCPQCEHPLGDLKSQRLDEIISSAPFKKFGEAASSCSLCSNSTTVEVSMFYSAEVFVKNRFRPTIRLRQFR